MLSSGLRWLCGPNQWHTLPWLYLAAAPSNLRAKAAQEGSANRSKTHNLNCFSIVATNLQGLVWDGSGAPALDEATSCNALDMSCHNASSRQSGYVAYISTKFQRSRYACKEASWHDSTCSYQPPFVSTLHLRPRLPRA